MQTIATAEVAVWVAMAAHHKVGVAVMVVTVAMTLRGVEVLEAMAEIRMAAVGAQFLAPQEEWVVLLR